MLKNIVSIEEFRINLADLVGRVMYGKDKIIIKKYKRDAAVLLSMEDYERLLDPTKRLTKSQWNYVARKLDSIRTNIPEADPDKIQKEIDLAIQEVRAEQK
ncbi:type II toxin-antitoxin system Phd/YefM family antitoxin [Patescibacteria group bacterium]|nr:type II toxin-antitoxin system Phd/YefM family antitoxin [Patescibacteria group bacterium]MCL5010362.1 type II toxin-antitoxin system Phd/YefM family antitoxin [Patescibacteria group bacterium]